MSYARSSWRLLRRVAGAAAQTRSVVPVDFTVVEASRPGALDLVALCRP